MDDRLVKTVAFRVVTIHITVLQVARLFHEIFIVVDFEDPMPQLLPTALGGGQFPHDANEHIWHIIGSVAEGEEGGPRNYRYFLKKS